MFISGLRKTARKSNQLIQLDEVKAVWLFRSSLRHLDGKLSYLG
jgi:hypothetical protein